MATEVTKARYHQDEWIRRGGVWRIDCTECDGTTLDDGRRRGYMAEEQADAHAIEHRCGLDDEVTLARSEKQTEAYWAIFRYLNSFYTIHHTGTQALVVDTEVEQLVAAMVTAGVRIEEKENPDG